MTTLKFIVIVIAAVATTTAVSCRSKSDSPQNQEGKMGSGTGKNDDQLKKQLTPEQYRVTQKCGTELPFTGKYYNFKGEGKYVCVVCGADLFNSETKYDSGTGWPSFYQPADANSVEENKDNSLLMTRTEIRCANCGAHLGHVFQDGPAPTGLRYCINSTSLQFIDANDTNSQPGH
ncbi:MAG: peptide-methionine (R)-S-oxide reductase MsrB [Phycisphaerae bacterium]|jgi:peptide-methionine (R)-S-oxide reductase